MRLQIRETQSVGILAALTIVAILLSVAVLIWGLRGRELEHSRLETVSQTQMLMEQTQQNFDEADLLLQGVQARLSDEYGRRLGLDSVQTHLLLSARASSMRQMASIFLVNAQGIVVNSSRNFPATAQSVADREYFQYFARDATDKLFIERPVRSRVDNSWTMHMARPMVDSDGKFRGVIVAAINIAQFEQMYKMVMLDYERPIAMYFADGTLIASSPGRENMTGVRAPELNNEEFPAKGGAVRAIQHVGGDGERQVFALGRLAKYPFLISVTDDEILSLASWRETAAPIGMGAMLISIFIAVLAVFLINKLKSREALRVALRAANDLYQHTVDSVMDAIVAADRSMNIILFNPAAEKMFGLPASKALGCSFEILIPERLRSEHRGHISRFAGADAVSRAMAPQLKITGRRGDGSEFPIESTISKSLIDGKLQLTAVLRDMTEQRWVESELREVNDQLRQLSASLQTVREEERTRISRELHDELGQQLTGLKLSFTWLATRLREGRATNASSVDEMREQLDAAVTSVKRISSELRPLILDDLGFDEAVSWHAREFSKRSALEVALNLPAAREVQDDNLATALFRIVQESLTNAARHANATRIRIDLVATANRLVLTISDNGQGISDHAGRGGIGIVSMRERVNSIGGKFSIVSGAGVGTTIEVIVPRLAASAAGDEA